MLVVGGASAWFLFSKKAENTSGTMSASTQTVQAKKGELKVAVSGSGSVTAVTSKDLTAADTVLVVDSVSVSSGETVSTGDTLVTFTNGETVTAAYDGEVSSVQVSSGSTASKGTILMRLTNDDDVKAAVTRGNTTSDNNVVGGSSLTVDTVKVEKNDVVKKGATLVTFTDGSVLKAPAAGTITSLSVSSGDTVDSATTIAHLTDYKSLQTTISVDELDISKIKVGQTVEITASAFEDEEFTGTVTAVATEGTSTNGVSTFDVTVKIKKPKNLKIGMSTEASILIENKEDALYVPIEAVYTSGDEKYVLVATDSSEAASKVTVETGISNDTYVEITSGLEEGASVQIPKVQSSGSSSGGMGQGGFPGGGRGEMPSGGFPGGGSAPSGNPPTGGGGRGGN